MSGLTQVTSDVISTNTISGLISQGFTSVNVATVGTQTIEFGSSNTLVFQANTSAERMRINSSGNVGIGTNSPSERLTVSGNTSLSGNLTFTGTGNRITGDFSNATFANRVGFQSSTTNGNTIIEAIPNGTATLSGFVCNNSADVNNSSGVNIVTTSTEARLQSFARGTGTPLPLAMFTNTLERLRIDTSGNVGIGTSSPVNKFNVVSSGVGYEIDQISIANTNLLLSYDRGAGAYRAVANYYGGNYIWNDAGTERMRIDSSGRVGIGISPSYKLDVYDAAAAFSMLRGDSSTQFIVSRASTDNTGGFVQFYKARGTQASPTIVASSDIAGRMVFYGYDGANYTGTAEIRATIDGTPGTADMPGRLGFYTTSDGSASLTERMRIASDGILYYGTTTANPPPNNVYGVTINASTSSGVYAAGVINASANGSAALSINRGTDDGTLVNFYQAGTVEGSITVSGTTVSYNGGHLSRWSQLPNNQKDDTLLKGTVMSNLDEMCVWTKDGEILPNEQLNKMKVSDVEGDTNVAGVFVNWDNEDISSPIDMNIAMTGDMIIRIAQGVVVQKGDLLMSAGDGTAKPQGDDIVRSKTIAKVTSNHVTCTYEDGSYCVPCVLMAC